MKEAIFLIYLMLAFCSRDILAPITTGFVTLESETAINVLCCLLLLFSFFVEAVLFNVCLFPSLPPLSNNAVFPSLPFLLRGSGVMMMMMMMLMWFFSL